MITSTTLYKNGELSFGAYANLAVGPTASLNNRGALRAAGFSPTQVSQFANDFPEVVAQFNDQGSSFSATVFRDANGTAVLAIRGTQELGDFIPTDLDIAERGAGYDQIVAMYNWWLKVSSPAGQDVRQFRFASYGSGTGAQPPAGALFL